MHDVAENMPPCTKTPFFVHDAAENHPPCTKTPFFVHDVAENHPPCTTPPFSCTTLPKTIPGFGKQKSDAGSS